MSLSSPKRILVVEDDNAVRELISTRLHLAGHVVTVACDGAQALERISQARPEAMILDLGLPKVDGFEVLGAMARNRWSIPTLVLTARHSQADVHTAISLGAWDYLAKPFSECVLMQRLDRLFQPRQCSEPYFV
jgi:two-component system response regulator MprA